MILGGRTSGGDTASVLSFDPERGTVAQWKNGNLTISRGYNPVVGRLRNEIVITSRGTSERFDPEVGRFVPGPTPVGDRRSAAGSVVGRSLSLPNVYSILLSTYIRYGTYVYTSYTA